MLGADDAGRGGVAAEVLRASPGELVVRLPEGPTAVSGETVVVSVGEPIDHEPFESDLFVDMTLDAFAAREQGMGIDLLAVVVEVQESVQTTKRGVANTWTVCEPPVAGERQTISISVVNPADGRIVTYTRTGRYAAGATERQVADDLAAWLRGKPTVNAVVRQSPDGKWQVIVQSPNIISTTITIGGDTHSIM
jgi:hypothetical protein